MKDDFTYKLLTSGVDIEIVTQNEYNKLMQWAERHNIDWQSGDKATSQSYFTGKPLWIGIDPTMYYTESKPDKPLLLSLHINRL